MKPFSRLSDTGYMSLNKQSECGEPPVNAKCMKRRGHCLKGPRQGAQQGCHGSGHKTCPCTGGPLSPGTWHNPELWPTEHKKLSTTSSLFKKL